MKKDFGSTLIYTKFVIIVASFCLIFYQGFADENHYKNILVGDRAAGLGGAYVAISDDSSGTFYNPAGIAFSFGDSISGSGNAYQTTRTEYKEAIANQSWYRESQAVLPNFFGMTKKINEFTFGLSYIVPDSAIEHQDEKYEVNNGVVNQYFLSLHSEDQTNMIGPSLAYQVSETLSVGMSLFYGYRIYRHQQNEFLILADGTTDVSYTSVKKEEYFYLPKFGLQYTPFDPVFIGVTYSQPISIGSDTTREHSETSSGEYEYSNSISTESRKYATQISIGIAAFIDPSLLVTTDIDYFMASDSTLETMMNYSAGVEWFLDADNAFRAGYFTNNDNRPECTESSCNEAHIDMTGYSFGYSSYTKTSGFTLGFIFSSGKGKADIYGDGSEIVDMDRSSFTAIFAANYNY